LISRSSSSRHAAAIVLLAVALAASAADKPIPAAPLCADDPRRSAGAEIRNDDKRTVAELLGIAPRSIDIQYSSTDQVEKRAREILEARPRFLSPFINWSEGADLRRQGFIVNLLTAEAASARLEVAGYQVCVRDGKGSYWYFRNVPLDLWPQ
jgi:hypothetical protein